MTTRRVVIDTNVFVAACFGGHAAHVVASWLAGNLRAIISQTTLDEYRHTLIRFPLAKPVQVALWEAGFADAKRSLWVSPESEPNLCKDSADNKFLAAALSGQATHLLTSDKLLLCIKNIEGTVICSARNFVEAGLALLPEKMQYEILNSNQE